MSDQNQSTSKYAALLADQAFNFTPYFDEAVCSWLRGNLGKLLKEQPAACKYFIRDDNHYREVAAALPLEEEYTKYIHDLVKFMEKRDDQYGFKMLTARYMEAKRADEAYDLCPEMAQKDSQLINALSASKFDAYLDEVKPENLYIDDEDEILNFFKKIPKEKFKKFLVSLDRYGNIYNRRRYRLVSSIAQTVPFEHFPMLMQYMKGNYSREFRCFSCGDKEAKSRPGYSLHRNKCDRDGLYPNLTEVMGSRLYKNAQGKE